MKYVLTTLSFIAFMTQNLAAVERPNMVMIFTDDQRHDAVGYAGNDAVQTPNLDRLAKQGLIFRELLRQYVNLRNQPSQPVVWAVSRAARHQ